MTTWAWALTLAVSALSGTAVAQRAGPADAGLNPYLAAGGSYDSNLLRLSDDEESELADKKSDRYATVEAGVDGSFDISRQRILLDGRIFHNAYEHYDDLDHTGGRGRLVWKWLLDPHWSGDFGYLYDRRLRDFSNQVVAVPIRDLRTENRGFFSIARTLGRGFSLSLGARLADVEFEESSSLDIERQLLSAGLFYETTIGTRIGFETEFLDGSFKNEDSRDYDEFRGRLILNWRLSAQNRLDAHIGYAERDNNDPNKTDFDGITGLIKLTRKGRDRDKLTASAWRDISTFGDEVANYAVVEGISIEPEWGVGRSSALRIFAGYENRDYKGFRNIGAPIPDLDPREDDIYTGSLWFDWRVVEIVTLSFGYTGEIRDSTRDTAEYDFNHIEVKVRVDL